MAGRIRFILFAAALLSLSCAPAFAWETLSDCRLKENNWNDGDSVHVMHGGREYIFRLCYVDTPEVHYAKELKARITDQAAYWKIKRKDLYQIAAGASAFTASALKNGFVVKTQWVDARGESHLPRYFAVITTPQGDLAELLLAKGYARIFGMSPDFPNGLSAREYEARLRAIEARARSAKAGAWADVSPVKQNKKAGKKKSAQKSKKATASSVG